MNQDIKENPLDKLEEMGIVSFRNNRVEDDRQGRELLKFIDKEAYIEECIDIDGRGHTLSSYDGQENEIYYEGTMYFIYRIN